MGAFVPPPEPWVPPDARVLTKPELLGDIAKAVGVLFPSPPEISGPIHASLEHLGVESQRNPSPPPTLTSHYLPLNPQLLPLPLMVFPSAP